MAPQRSAPHTAGPNHMEAYMKLPLPAADALAGAAQAQIDLDAPRHGGAFSNDLATLFRSTTPVTHRDGMPLQSLRLKTAPPPPGTLPASGGSMMSLN